MEKDQHAPQKSDGSERITTLSHPKRYEVTWGLLGKIYKAFQPPRVLCLISYANAATPAT